MATLPNGTFANPTEPLYASAYGINTNLTMNSLTLTGSPPLVLTNNAGVLAQNGFSDILTSLWSTTPATSNRIYMDTSNILSNVGSNLYFAGTLLADAGAVPNIADWSLYAQLSNINGNAFAISNSSGYSGTGNIATTGGNITTSSGNITTSSGNVSGASGTFPTLGTSQINGTGTFGNLGITSSNEIIVNADAINNTSGAVSFDVDGGVNIINYADFEVNASNGNRGRINLTASGGFSNGVFGEVNITANGGVTPSIGGVSFATGGLINLTANTPIATTNTSTSAIKLSASSVLSYAGSVSPTFSTAGYQYLYGQAGVNIVCSVSPPVLPSLPLSIYMYSDAGTRISNGLRTDTIANINPTAGVLAIQSFGVGSYVTLSNIRSIAGSSPATITGFSNITTSNIGLSTINNSTYLPTSSWATQPATQSVNLSNFQISNCSGLSSSTGLGVYGNAVTIGALGSNSNVEIQANNGGGSIVLTPSPTGNVTAPSLVVSSNITTSNINLSNINGVPYAPTPATWSSYPATQNINASNFSISNATGVSSSSSLTLAGQGIALNSTGTNNLTMTTASTGNISMTAGGGVLLTSTTGDVELTAGAGSKIDMKSDVNMFSNSIINLSNITSTIPIAITGQSVSVSSTGNNPITLTASGTGDLNLASTSGTIQMTSPVRQTQSVSRVLSGSNITQPIFQYGQINSTGNTGDQLVFLGVPYATSGSFLAQVTMADNSPAKMSVANISSNSFRIYWEQAGSGTHNINWLVYGG
jgi:hypothetical protein